MGYMAPRKWKEIKQQPDTAGPGNILGCCLLSFHFLWPLWAIHPIRPVHILPIPYLEGDYARVVVVQCGKDVVGVGAERGWNGGGAGIDVVFFFGQDYADRQQSGQKQAKCSRLNCHVWPEMKIIISE